MTETLEKVLIYEDEARMKLLREYVDRDLPRVREMVAAHQAIEVFPPLNDLSELERFREIKTVKQLEKVVRNILAEQFGSTINGIAVDRERVAEMIKLPEGVDRFAKAVGVAFTNLSFDLSLFKLNASGKVIENEAAINARTETYRTYARTEQELERLADAQALADHINSFAEKHGVKGFFREKEIPLLGGTFLTKKDGGGVTVGYTGGYRVDAGFVKNKKPAWQRISNPYQNL